MLFGLCLCDCLSPFVCVRYFVSITYVSVYLNSHISSSLIKDIMEGDSCSPNLKSYSGIPEAVFVDNVDEFMNKPENSGGVNKVLRNLDEQHAKYKHMEVSLATKRRRLRQQIPDLARSLEMIEKLKIQNEIMETKFLLSDQVFVKANIPPTDKVCLWLGANVMLEYTLDDAENLLTANMATAKKNLSCVEHDLDFLRDQWTTTEVNMARVYNWDVKKRQAAKASS